MRHVLVLLSLWVVLSGAACLSLLTPPPPPPRASAFEQILEYQRAMAELKKMERSDVPDGDRGEGAISQLRRDLQRILQGIHDALKDLDEALRRHDQKGRSSL